jgi:BirA family biotin operon repressor/biotin-[acetyl-CoA-carboxylase] ligase
MASQSIDVSAIKKGLPTRFIGRQIIFYPHLTSTMDAARREAKNNVPEGTVIIAGEQTKGRGRLQRAWLAPAGNIALSVILYPDVSGLPYLIMIASLAAAHSIEGVTGLATQIKWPNDVLIRGKKVAGILIENEVKGGRAAYAIVGVGINVALQAAAIGDLASIATGLEAELGRKVSRERIIKNFLTEFERLYLKLPEGQEIFSQWRQRLVTLGKRVTVKWGEEILAGVAESVDEGGALGLRLDSGQKIKVVAGDVTLSQK